MPLNAQAQALLQEMSKQGLPPFEQMSPTFARVVAMSFRDLQGEPENVAEVRDILVPGPAGKLPVRVYHPTPGEKLPLLVYFHGGGWVIGDIEVVDRPCRALANAGHCVVASVNYRLSPETKFPGPVEDCYAATALAAIRCRSQSAAARDGDHRGVRSAARRRHGLCSKAATGQGGREDVPLRRADSRLLLDGRCDRPRSRPDCRDGRRAPALGRVGQFHSPARDAFGADEMKRHSFLSCPSPPTRGRP